jgi:ribosomal-protein-alanine acetyltransferase
MGKIFFRSADSADRDRLVSLAEESPGAPCWTLTTWEKVLESAATGERNVLIAASEEGIVGFGVVGIAGDAAELESLAVIEAARRQGIGRRLYEELMRWARTHGSSRAVLEVRVSNHAARALYESLGFREITLRRGYYREPEEDGLMMAREL